MIAETVNTDAAVDRTAGRGFGFQQAIALRQHESRGA
jgi:hypothetical protein